MAGHKNIIWSSCSTPTKYSRRAVRPTKTITSKTPHMVPNEQYAGLRHMWLSSLWYDFTYWKFFPTLSVCVCASAHLNSAVHYLYLLKGSISITHTFCTWSSPLVCSCGFLANCSKKSYRTLGDLQSSVHHMLATCPHMFGDKARSLILVRESERRVSVTLPDHIVWIQANEKMRDVTLLCLGFFIIIWRGFPILYFSVYHCHN